MPDGAVPGPAPVPAAGSESGPEPSGGPGSGLVPGIDDLPRLGRWLRDNGILRWPRRPWSG